MINRKNVHLIFYKPRTFYQKFKAYHGCSVCSIGILVGKFAYKFEKDFKFLQEIHYNDDKRLRKKYLVIDTGFKVSDLKEGWRDKLLKQKARDWDSLFTRHRCVKSARCILDQLDYKWRYRLGDMFVNIYFKRRIK